MNNLLNLLNNTRVKGLIAVAGAVIMYFAPDHIDAIIEGILATLGIPSLFIGEKKINH